MCFVWLEEFLDEVDINNFFRKLFYKKQKSYQTNPYFGSFYT